MKLYKYRTVDPADAASCQRLERIIRHGLIWCARPDTLNDPDEFAWTCDFTPSPRTIDILAGLLQKTKGYSPQNALRGAGIVLANGTFGSIGRAVIDETIDKMRDEIGIACFGVSSSNSTLWSRYADGGTGVAVELDVPDSLLGSQLHRVVYDDNRRIHIDGFIRSMDDRHAAVEVYATMLTKTRRWEPEGEVRFISKRQRIEVMVDGSTVTRVVLGPRISPAAEAVVRALAGPGVVI